MFVKKFVSYQNFGKIRHLVAKTVLYKLCFYLFTICVEYNNNNNNDIIKGALSVSLSLFLSPTHLASPDGTRLLPPHFILYDERFVPLPRACHAACFFKEFTKIYSK